MMTAMEPDPVQVLLEGSEILRPVMERAGYGLGEVVGVLGSGGAAASVRWLNGDRYVEMHFRYSLGLVSYGWHSVSFDHASYMRLLAVPKSYPGYSRELLDGFRHLRDDLVGSANGLLTMDMATFTATAEAIRSLPPLGLP